MLIEAAFFFVKIYGVARLAPMILERPHSTHCNFSSGRGLDVASDWLNILCRLSWILMAGTLDKGI
jgi:hypothetical protein